MISIVILSQNTDLSIGLFQNIEQTIGVSYELVFIDNADNKYSLFEAYNLGVQRSAGDIICFMHDDIQYISNDWGIKVEHTLSLPDIGACAVAGCKYMRQSPSYYPIGEGYNVINLIQCTNDTEIIWHTHDEDQEIVVFDGLWFCIRKECFNKIQFDVENFEGFHFYDIDIATQLVANGYRIMSLCDVLIRHHSGGKTNRQWLENSFIYADKWKNELPLSCMGISAKEAERIECTALYSAFRKIMITRHHKLIPKWFQCASRITHRNYFSALYFIINQHRNASNKNINQRCHPVL